MAQARGHGSVSRVIVREVKRDKHHTVWHTPAAGTPTDGRLRDGAPHELRSPSPPEQLRTAAKSGPASEGHVLFKGHVSHVFESSKDFVGTPPRMGSWSKWLR